MSESHTGEIALPKVKSGPEIAKAFFMKAAYEYQASATAQGIRILQLCREDGRNPRQLLTELLADDSTIEALVEGAKNAHRHAERKPDFEITTQIMRDTAAEVFDHAYDLSVLPPEELRGLLDEYTRYHQKDKGKRDEFAYWIYAEGKINRYKKQLDRQAKREQKAKVPTGRFGFFKSKK